MTSDEFLPFPAVLMKESVASISEFTDTNNAIKILMHRYLEKLEQNTKASSVTSMKIKCHNTSVLQCRQSVVSVV